MRYLSSIIILLEIFFLTCADLDRDNVLDPKNAGSFMPRKNLVEVFVNDSTGYPYSRFSLNALDEIRSMDSFTDNLLILEYHVESGSWNDSYEQAGCLARYHKYVPEAATRGIPDAFFNGAANRVQGASSENVKGRYLEKLAAFSDDDAYFRFVGEKTIINNEFQLDLQIARLGNQSAADLTLQVIIYEDLGIENHRGVVRKILSPVIISGLDAGEVKSFSFETSLSVDVDLSRTYAVAFVQKADSKMEVFQAEKF